MFAVLSIQVIFLKASVDQLGGYVFVTYAFFDFFTMFGVLMMALYEGTWANTVDLYFKEFLMKLMGYIADTKELAIENVFYEH